MRNHTKIKVRVTQQPTFQDLFDNLNQDLAFKWSQMFRKVYSNETKLNVVELFKKGLIQREISETLDVHKSVVSRILSKCKKNGFVKTLPRTGRPRKTSKREDRAIERQATKNPFSSAPKIKSTLGLNISTKTIKWRLAENNLFLRKPAKKPLLTKKQRISRLKFARDHIDWDIKKWSNVLFTDESKFQLEKI